MSFLRKNLYSFIKLGFSYLLGKNYPFVTVLRLNDACNMSCSYCDSYKLSKAIEINALLSFLDNIYQKGCRFIILTGGEAFLYKDREKLMEWFEGKGIYLVINTNGKLINQSEYTNFLKKADEVLISIDGPEEFNDHHRGKGTHQKVIQTLDFLKQQKKKITLSVVLTKYNSQEEVYEYIRKLKIKYNATVGINPVTANGRINSSDFSHSAAVPHSELKNFRDYINRHRKSFKEIPAMLLDYIVSPRPFICKSMSYAIYIDVDHGIYPCINVTDRPEARFADIESFDGKYQKTIECQQCNCTPLIMGNLMFQDGRFPSLKKVFNIIKRHL
ncbi:MAG: radical SAM protein [Candidatus Caldatribacteriota bacterium]